MRGIGNFQEQQKGSFTVRIMSQVKGKKTNQLILDQEDRGFKDAIM